MIAVFWRASHENENFCLRISFPDEGGVADSLRVPRRPSSMDGYLVCREGCDFDHAGCPHPCMRSCTHLCSIFPHTRITSANGVGDNVQAFEEKFNIFLMLDPTLVPFPPGNIAPPDMKNAMVNKTWTTLLRPPRHAYTKSWYESLMRTVM